jgi:cytochrome b subunit of formate dehydrogenase
MRAMFAFAVIVVVSGGACASFAAPKPKDQECLACHGDKTLTTTENGKTVSLYVDSDKFKHSTHSRLFGCVDCHTDVKEAVHTKTPMKVECGTCHEKEQAAWQGGMHARDKSKGATCVDCHGDAHEITGGGDPKSLVSHAMIPATCGRCHGQKFVVGADGVSAQTYMNYQESVHGKAIANGSTKAAVCTDCHGDHEILAANNDKSPINKFNVPQTCGKCHVQISQTFMQSIHGQGIAKGNGLAPSCTDCHGIHSIKSHLDPNSSVSEQNVARTTCARCHEGVRLSQEFGFAGNRESTYLDSYHGLATQGGSVVVANCASCHGVHNILPSSDPRSTINKANLDVTCGQCHKGVTQKFTQTKVHMDSGGSKDVGSIVVKWIRWIYLLLIFGVIGAMALHNGIIWRSKTAKIRAMQNPMMTRMSTNQRWQHLVLLTSFIVLVLTGFALKFPHSWFAQVLALGEITRSVTHRVAGVVLIAAGIYHVFYLAMLAEGRRLIRDLTPRPKDVTDAWGTMLYHLGLRKDRPQFGRFTYGEKAEYWALVWGTALMGLTGIMLWAKVWVGNLLARWWVDAATAVHYYEAILATLAIVVWHFYQVIFDPDVYPMNMAWWDGKMPVEKYKHEHGADVETLKNEGEGKME